MKLPCIHKYQLALGVTVLTMPANARVLDAQNQRSKVMLWALVDELQPVEQRSFLVVGTGFGAPDNARYISTAQFHNGESVCHIFELMDETRQA